MQWGPEIAQSFKKVVRLLTSAAREAMERGWLDEEAEVTVLLTRLAALAEQIIPSDFDFGDYPEDT